MSEKQETEEQIDYLLPYLQDFVRQQNEREVEWVESPFRIRFGSAD